MRSSVSLTLLLAGCAGGEYARDTPMRVDGAQRGPVAPVYRDQQLDAPPPLDMDRPPELAGADGPSATASDAENRYDSVGYASWYGDELRGRPTASGAPFDPDGISLAHRTLPLGAIVEVTSLDTGQTILALVNDRGPDRRDREADLSRGAMALLGAAGRPVLPVRLRAVTAHPADIAALRAGKPAAERLAAPPGLLAALRRRLGDWKAAEPRPLRRIDPPVRPLAGGLPRVPPATAPVRQGRYVVQVAAFSSEARARALAATLRGTVASASGLHRVRLGPFRTLGEAQAARDDAARRGYGDAQILDQP